MDTRGLIDLGADFKISSGESGEIPEEDPHNSIFISVDDICKDIGQGMSPFLGKEYPEILESHCFIMFSRLDKKPFVVERADPNTATHMYMTIYRNRKLFFGSKQYNSYGSTTTLAQRSQSAKVEGDEVQSAFTVTITRKKNTFDFLLATEFH